MCAYPCSSAVDPLVHYRNDGVAVDRAINMRVYLTPGRRLVQDPRHQPLTVDLKNHDLIGVAVISFDDRVELMLETAVNEALCLEARMPV